MAGSKEILCRLCIGKDVDLNELAEYLDHYVESLPEDEKCPDDAYRERLQYCAACEFHLNFTCRRCGCYVQARAAKRRMSCPIPGNPKWEPV